MAGLDFTGLSYYLNIFDTIEYIFTNKKQKGGLSNKKNPSFGSYSFHDHHGILLPSAWPFGPCPALSFFPAVICLTICAAVLSQ
jgi:hypothetical protein